MSTVFPVVGTTHRRLLPHPQPRVLEEIEVFVDDVEMLLLLGREDPEERFFMPVRRVFRHAGVHLPPLGLETEGLPHRHRGVPGDRFLLLDPAVLPLEEAHPALAAHGGDRRELPALLEIPPLHVGQEGEHPFRESVRGFLRGHGEVAHPGLLETEGAGNGAGGDIVLRDRLYLRHRETPLAIRMSFHSIRSGIRISKKNSGRRPDHPFFLGRRLASRIFFRMRTEEGVISTNSSSLMNSRAASRERTRGGTSRSASSAPAARMLVSFFSLQMLMSMSTGREFSPTIIPSYTCSPSPLKKIPRDCRWKMAYAVARPPPPAPGPPPRDRRRARPRTPPPPVPAPRRPRPS